jgi:hypothetical protein
MAQTINVDVTPSLFQPTLYYHQGDVGRQFAINISTKDGYEIPSGATVKIEATKPSGFGFSVEGTLSGNTVTFVSTEGMTDEWGRFPAQLEITSGNTVIYTANFLMVGEKDTHPASTVDGSQEDVIPQLTLLVERVENAAAAVLDTTTVVETLPAGSQATYSFDEESNTATFGIPQGEAGAGSAGVVASAYSASKTYAVGDYAIHNSNLYRCTTAITTAESFNASHWTQVVLADDVTDLKNDLQEAIDDFAVPTQEAVDNWLDDHPEATTTVQDHSLTHKKLVNGTLGFVTPEMYDAKGDGITDDTVAIQSAINTGKTVWFSPKTYVVSAGNLDENHVALNAVDGMAIIGNGATLKLDANSYTRYRIIKMLRVNNVYIDGLNIVGDKAEHTGTTGEQGYGFAVIGSTNVHIDNCTASYCWGDGLNVASTYAPSEAESVMCREIYVNNFESHHNHRQGISVEGCDGFYLDGAYIHDIGGTAPQSAIDFEPSPYVDEDTQEVSHYEYIDNVFVSNLKCENNLGNDITVDDYHSTRKGQYLFSNCSIPLIKISSIVEGLTYGSHVQMNNVTFKQKVVSGTAYTAIELNVNNPNTNFFGDDLTIFLNGRSPITFDSILKGKMFINGLSVLGDTANNQLFVISVYDIDALKNVVVKGVYAPNNLKYLSVANENKAQSGATVELAKDIIESSKQGWFYIDSIANVYYFGADKTANSYIQMFHMYDGYEMTIINESNYQVQLQKENANRPNIFFDTLTNKTVKINKGIVKLKYSTKMNAWLVVSYIGDVTAS